MDQEINKTITATGFVGMKTAKLLTLAKGGSITAPCPPTPLGTFKVT